MNGIGLTLVEPAEVNMIKDKQVLPDGSEDMLNSASKQHAGDNIGNYIQGQLFTYYRNARRNEQEDICLDAERAYNNKYNLAEQTQLAIRKQESGDSTVWVPYTRTKVNIAVAKTYEKMLNASDTPWSIVPEQLSEENIQLNQQRIMMAIMEGALQDDPAKALEKLNELDEKEAQDACEEMEKEIADQMSKGKTFTEIARVILHQHYLGTGVAKFEITVDTNEKWVKNLDGQWNLEETETPFPQLKFRNWFNIFTDPYAITVEESNGLIERHVVRRSDLLGYKASQGFKVDKIKEVITNNPSGNHTDLDYETTIRAVNNQDENVQQNDGYYDVYEAWVELPGDKLIEYGYTHKIKPTGAYRVNCWVCDNVTIKLIMNPHTPQRVPYFMVPYEENVNTTNGTGIAEDLSGVQEVINAVTRATIDNAAFSHAPITEINLDLLKDGEEAPTVLKPRSILHREGGDPKEPLARFYNIPENSQVLFNVYNLFNQIGQDVTGISSSTEESMPAANTPNMGISMAMSQKNILQRSVVGNIDKYLIKPMVEMYYNFNMKWSTKESIKAQAKITANGVTSIIAKEMRSQQLMAFAQLTNNPEDKALVDRKKTLENLATSLDQDGEDLVYSDSDAAERNKAQGEAQKQAAMAEQQGIISQIDAENRGEIEQERIKGSQAMRKQRLIETSKIQQLAMKEEAEISSQEFELIKQLRMMQEQQQNNNQSAMLNTQLTQGVQQNEK